MKRKPQYYRFFVVVEGAGRFPIDMLRYDSCVPSEEADSSLVETDRHGRRRVTLECFTNNPAGLPEKARWLSYGWCVVGVYDDQGAASDAKRGVRV